MISVCMATYNGEKYLREQVNSILEQLGEEDELIVSDDGSIDLTIDILRSYTDPRIKILLNKNRHGVNGNFENALRHASGDYIFLSDQDDVWLPGKVEVCVSALQNANCVVHDCYVVDKDLNIISNSFFAERDSKSGFIHNWIKNGYLGCAMAFKKNVLDIVLPIPSGLPVWHDIWIGLLCEIKYGVTFVPFKGIYFRRHSSNTSITSKASFSIIKQISYRIKELPYIFYRIIR